MVNIGIEEGGKRAYHAPTVQEFGTVSEATKTGDICQYIPQWCDWDPHDPPGGIS
jgi:hypothetical protein